MKMVTLLKTMPRVTLDPQTIGDAFAGFQKYLYQGVA